jgi:hypothetical protein
MFYDVPEEGAANPRLGAYGRYDPASGRLEFDHAKRMRLEETTVPAQCGHCPCRFACQGHSGVRGRMPLEMGPRDDTCLARLGVLKALLRRMLPSSGRVEEVLHE